MKKSSISLLCLSQQFEIVDVCIITLELLLLNIRMLDVFNGIIIIITIIILSSSVGTVVISNFCTMNLQKNSLNKEKKNKTSKTHYTSQTIIQYQVKQKSY